MENKKFIVGDQYRKNELAFIPGGYDVTIQYLDNRADRIYPNIHSFKGYAKKVYTGKEGDKIKNLIFHHPSGNQNLSKEEFFNQGSPKIEKKSSVEIVERPTQALK